MSHRRLFMYLCCFMAAPLVLWWCGYHWYLTDTLVAGDVPKSLSQLNPPSWLALRVFDPIIAIIGASLITGLRGTGYKMCADGSDETTVKHMLIFLGGGLALAAAIPMTIAAQYGLSQAWLMGLALAFQGTLMVGGIIILLLMASMESVDLTFDDFTGDECAHCFLVLCGIGLYCFIVDSMFIGVAAGWLHTALLLGALLSLLTVLGGIGGILYGVGKVLGKLTIRT